MKAACLQLQLWALCLVTLAGGQVAFRDRVPASREAGCSPGGKVPQEEEIRSILPPGQPRAPLKCSVECLTFTKQLEEKRIRGYRLTEPSCKKSATIFITVRSREICANSSEEWVQKIKDKLDGITVMPPRAVTSAEKPGNVERHIGLPETAPSQATAPASFFQGTGTTVRERIHAPSARTEVSSKSPVGRQDPTQLPAECTPVVQEEAVPSEVTPEAKRESSVSPLSSAAVAAGMGPSQPTPHPTVQDTASPNSNSNLMPATKESDQPVLSPSGSLDPTSARASTPDTASSSSRSDLPSFWDSMKTTTDTEKTPQATSLSTLSPTSAIDKAASTHTNRVVGTTTFEHSLPVGKQEPSDPVVLTHQAFSGQARVQMITVRPKNLPLPSFLSKSQMHFIIPVSVVCGLMVSSVVLVWVYLKFGVKPEETSREMVQGLLYQQAGHQENVYPMEVI